MDDMTNPANLAHLANRLHQCGPRVIFELLRDMVAGRDPAEIVTDFSRLDPCVYAALCLRLIDAGASQ